jgi:hypothetical protein
MTISVTAHRATEEHLRRYGALLKRDSRGPLDDQGLWDYVRQLNAQLPEHVDAGLLPGFRHAFDAGFQPHLVDLHATASRLRALGLHTEMQRAGTEVVLAAGRLPHAGTNDDPWPVEVGPRWECGTDVLGHTDTLTVGRTDGINRCAVPAGSTPPQVAELAIRLLDADPDQWEGPVVATTVMPAAFADSQHPADSEALALIHDGVQWTETFQLQLAALVDERLADQQPQRGLIATVFTGEYQVEAVTRTTGLITHRHANQLIFSDGHTLNGDLVLSIHIHAY